MRTILLSLSLGLTSLLAIGCGGGTVNVGSGNRISMERVALQDLSEIYRVYTETNNKPPEKLSDFRSLANVGPSAFKAIESGSIIVRYGALMVDTNEGPAGTKSDEVLAYEKKAPESGGDVLMLDRRVMAMTAEEFKAAKKAGKD